MSPEIILGAKKENRKLSNLMAKVLDVGGDISWVVNFCRPPSTNKMLQSEQEGSLISCNSMKNKTKNSCNTNLKKVSLPVCSQFDPDDVSIFGFLSSPAIIAEPASIRHSDVQAVWVKSCRTGLTAQQLSSCKTTRHSNKPKKDFV